MTSGLDKGLVIPSHTQASEGRGITENRAMSARSLTLRNADHEHVFGNV